jgi:hypothetical protein
MNQPGIVIPAQVWGKQKFRDSPRTPNPPGQYRNRISSGLRATAIANRIQTRLI